MSDAHLDDEFSYKETVEMADAAMRTANPFGLAISLEIGKRQDWTITRIESMAEKTKKKTELLNKMLKEFQERQDNKE